MLLCWFASPEESLRPRAARDQPAAVNSGVVSGSADHDIKFWEWQVMEEEGSGLRQLSLAHTRTLKMTDDVLCIRISPDGAFALLDSRMGPM